MPGRSTRQDLTTMERTLISMNKTYQGKYMKLESVLSHIFDKVQKAGIFLCSSLDLLQIFEGLLTN